MKNNEKLSSKTVKILTGIGVAFGAVMVFFISFFLSFNFMVNPISISVADDDIKQENMELKSQVKALEDEVELLNTTIEKYRNKASAPTPLPDIDNSSSSSTNTTQKTVQTDKSSESQTPSGSDKTTNTSADNEEEEQITFTPETVITPNDSETNTSITIIDVSE